MGGCCSKQFTKALEANMCKLQMKTLMVGLEGSGKTTILYQLKLKKVVETIPTLGFNLEEIDGYGDIWDLGGQPKIRHLWKHYYDRIWVIIFVVDSTDGARLDNKGGDNGSVQQSSMELINGLLFSLNRENSESVLGDDVTDISGGYPSYQHPTAKEELHRLMKEDELRNAVLLIFANKQDLPNAMSINEITARLELNKLRNRSWYIVGTSAIEPFGLREGLNWLKRKQSD